MLKKIGEENKNSNKIISNWLLNFSGIAIMNAVLQLIIFPFLNRQIGSEKFGIVLYLMAFVSIMSPSFGQAAMNARLVGRRNHDYKNGDFNIVLLLFCFITIAITLITAHSVLNGVLSNLLMSGVLLLTTWRYYADVEFRMNLSFNKYFFYYLILSIGYILGYGFYLLTSSWYLIFITGELAALCYVWFIGHIFKPFLLKGKDKFSALKASVTLALSYLLFHLSLQLDRIILKSLIGNIAVSEYFVVSLIGKALVLLVSPLNAIILSYLSRSSKHIDRKTFGVYSGLIILGCMVFLAICQLVVPVFIRILYPDMYENIKNLIFIANLAQILSVASTTVFVIVLTFTKEIWQVILQLIHIVLFVIISIILTKLNGVEGFAIAALIANTIRLVSIILVGIVKASDRKEELELI